MLSKFQCTDLNEILSMGILSDFCVGIPTQTSLIVIFYVKSAIVINYKIVKILIKQVVG